MPDNLKLLIVILALATVAFAFARRPATACMESADFTRRRNLWYALTFAAFLAPNFWAYTFVAIPLLVYANRRETNPPALFFFVLFALPMNTVHISGMGYALFGLSHARILEIIIFLPAFFFLLRKGSLSFGRTAPDKLIAAYLLLTVAVYLRDNSLTHALRQTLHLFLDVFIPYVVVSRYLTNLQAFRDALSGFVVAMMVLAVVAVFEFFKFWLLYQPLGEILEMDEAMTGYIVRDGMLRVVASAGQPIVLGYLMVAGMGFYMYLKDSIPQKLLRRAGMALLIAGLIVPVSRGPWIGAAVFLVAFILSGRGPAKSLVKLAVAAMLAFPLVAVLPGTDRAVNLIPFIGSTEKENVDYRANLMTNSMIVIQRYPWFGSSDFHHEPEMEALRQGEGIIDIVNTYLRVALEKGLVGLGLFVGFFALTLSGIYRAMRSISDKESEEYLLGRTLLATLLAILMIIFTVSSITFVPIVYWSVAAMGVAYARMVRRRANETDQGAAEAAKR